MFNNLAYIVLLMIIGTLLYVRKLYYRRLFAKPDNDKFIRDLLNGQESGFCNADFGIAVETGEFTAKVTGDEAYCCDVINTSLSSDNRQKEFSIHEQTE